MDSTQPEIKKPSTENNADDFVLVNVYEDIVGDYIRDMIPTMGMCKCQKCFSDACALVLNQLMPKYVTTRQGELMSLTFQMKMDIKSDLSVLAARAVLMVKESPKH